MRMTKTTARTRPKGRTMTGRMQQTGKMMTASGIPITMTWTNTARGWIQTMMLSIQMITMIMTRMSMTAMTAAVMRTAMSMTPTTAVMRTAMITMTTESFSLPN